MPRAINFTKIVLKRIMIDPASRSVSAEYLMTDESGEYRRAGTAVFWQTMPTDMDGAPLPVMDDWFQLTAGEVNTVTNIFIKVRDTITAKLLA